MKTYADIVGDGGSDILGQVEAQHAQLARRMEQVGAVIAVSSGKGGVGKSSVTVNIAAALARKGLQVGVLDADINGASIARMLGVRDQELQYVDGSVVPATGPEGIRVMSMDLLLPDDDTPVRWRATTDQAAFTWRQTMEMTVLRELLTDTNWGELDCLLLDLPPGSDRLPNVAEILPKTAGAIAVTVPSHVSNGVVRRALTAAREAMGARVIGLVDNMAGYVCPHCHETGPLFPEGASQSTANDHQLPVLGRVPFEPALAHGCDRGIPYVLENPEGPAAVALEQVADRLLEWMKQAQKTELEGAIA